MFDPTIFDNLKTVVEGAIYDLDISDELITVVDRSDVVDLAKFTRAYALSFQLRHAHEVTCTISLAMTLQHIANELLYEDATHAGCTVTVSFSFLATNVDGADVEQTLKHIWGERRIILQTLTYTYGQNERYTHEVTIDFGRTINESHVDDLLHMIPYIIRSLEQLQQYAA
ncbi:hypothetical protein [Anoxybacillus suryakundensis]|uniref:Uncharacterized protein n=1 Tax=Anoxybacillus suryakundensis TaxID=1325335 RepID=A0A0K6GNF4_9BACL|nr:hypothetical protein [Anoxybacillus suryakundensis]CUA80225.1 hypothetical protein Ga0061060_10855 [Anoxybacillus suryakundensis]